MQSSAESDASDDDSDEGGGDIDDAAAAAADSAPVVFGEMCSLWVVFTDDDKALEEAAGGAESALASL